MQLRRFISSVALSAAVIGLVLPARATAQTVNGAIVGVVQDSSGGVVPDVALTLRNIARDEMVNTIVTGADGAFAFRNVPPGKYEVQATKDGFNPVAFPDVEVTLGSQVKVDVTLTAGGVTERVEVVGGASVLATTATQEHAITPETLDQLPLLMNSGPRAAATFATLMPGVSTGGGNNAFDARINGGLQSGDEASVDGVSMQQGFMSQGGMVSIFQDFPMSPDMVSEVKVLTSNYAPEYGSTTGGQIMAVTKSGGSSFHGTAFNYHRDESLKAQQWGASSKPEFSRNNYGAAIGGPAALPFLTTDKWKSYFYFVYEGYRQKGGSNQPTLSLPTSAMRGGDFREWRDTAGNLIPIYDPATLRPDGNGGYVKDQFMGCDGKTPNVICANRITAEAKAYLSQLPDTNKAGILNNYLGPAIPDTILGNSDYYMGRYDLQIGNNDHMFASFWHQRAPAKFVSTLPQSIATETYSDPQNSWVNRFNYDKILTPTLLNHMSAGYLNRNEGYGCVNQDFVDQFPKVPGVAGYNVPPAVSFSDGYASMGCNGGVNLGNITTRPTFIMNDAVTWTKGSHSFKVGMEYRKIMGNTHANGGQAGSFNFGRGATGVDGAVSGNPIASFLLGAVDNGNATFRAESAFYPRQSAWVLHAGDTWRVNNKLTFDYGVRWDYYSPSSEKFDRLTFFNPNGANSGAGNRLGDLAYAGDAFGSASYGKSYPEKPFYGGFAPRLGAVYALNDKTVIRTGWGIFYMQAFYPGWGGGMSQDGFSVTPGFSSTLNGIQPAFYLADGLPQNFEKPPIVSDAYKNGQGILYRPEDGNKRSYSHQWNITVDRELGKNLAVSIGYVGSAGRRMPSSLDPLNAINPSYLSLGSKLNDEFQPGQASLHGVPLPYAGWVEQMTGCAPTVAQALRAYPQYCDSLQGLNENHGTSLYNSMQLKVEKRYSNGIYALVSYTLSKTTQNSSENTQRDALTWSGVDGVFSPYEKSRAKSTAFGDIPNVLSLALVYELPFGKGKKFMNEGGVANAILGGWQMSTIYKYSSGVPYYFRSGYCNVPGQFRAACVPAIINGGSVFAQDKGDFDPGLGPLFNVAAFEPVSSFNYYYGQGNRVEDSVRGFAYKNQDLSLVKNTRMGGGTNLQLRFEVFNMWNWHIFSNPGQWGGLAFNNDINSPDFGNWNGAVTEPRTMQVAIRFEF
jgi:hypothetical protein